MISLFSGWSKPLNSFNLFLIIEFLNPEGKFDNIIKIFSTKLDAVYLLMQKNNSSLNFSLTEYICSLKRRIKFYVYVHVSFWSTSVAIKLLKIEKQMQIPKISNYKPFLNDRIRNY